MNQKHFLGSKLFLRSVVPSCPAFLAFGLPASLRSPLSLSLSLPHLSLPHLSLPHLSLSLSLSLSPPSLSLSLSLPHLSLSLSLSLSLLQGYSWYSWILDRQTGASLDTVATTLHVRAKADPSLALHEVTEAA